MPVALITNACDTNVCDFAGLPAVDALGAVGFRVLASDRTFSDAATLSAFQAAHPHAEPLHARDPAELIGRSWDEAGPIDVIVSNDHFPAVHGPSENASLELFRETLERLVIDPFALLKVAIPRFKAQGSGAVVMITSCRPG